MRPDVTLALSVGLTLCVLSIGALRVVDLNEKEPLWALGLLLWLGILAAGGAALVHGPERSALDAALLAEGAKAAAIAAGIAVITVVGRRRGASELNSFLDCLLYGAAAGAGFAVGDGFLRATYSAATELQSPEPRGAVDLLWMTVQSCLTEAAFAALLGAALGGVVMLRSRMARAAILPAGLVGAAGAHALYASLVLVDGVHEPGVSPAGVAAVVLVLAAMAAALAHALTREQRTIAAELAGELETGAVTPAELNLLTHPRQRQRSYVARLAAGEIDQWLADRRLQGRQVALAFAKRRGAREADEIRAAILALRSAGGQRRRRPRVAAFVAAALLLLAGIGVMATAGGEQAPSTFATRTSLAAREAARLEARGPTSRTLRAEISLVPARWTLDGWGRGATLLAAGAHEAYELRYRGRRSPPVRYTIARFASPAVARRQAERLGRPADADAWATGELVAQVRGPRATRMRFCRDVGGEYCG